MSPQPTNQDILNAVATLDAKVNTLNTKVSVLATNQQDLVETINDFSTHVDKRFDALEGRVTKIESTMVTKDYLDEKMADLRGDLTVLIRKEDTKVKALVDLLVERNVLEEPDRKKLFSMEPFADKWV